MSKKSKPTPELVDPMTVEWPREAFKVGDEVMVKPEYAKMIWGLDGTRPLIFSHDDKTGSPLFMDHKNLERYVGLWKLVPLSKIREYEAYKAGKKPMTTLKPHKPTITEKALAIAQDKVKKAQESVDGIKRIIEIDKLKAANAAEISKLNQERAELAKKWLKGPRKSA